MIILPSSHDNCNSKFYAVHVMNGLMILQIGMGRVPGLGFNGVLIDLQHHFETYSNFLNLSKISTEIYDNVVDFTHLCAVESQPMSTRQKSGAL